MLLVTLAGSVFTGYAAFHSAPSAAKISFKTGVKEDSGGLRSFATPEAGDTLWVGLELTPYHQNLGGVSVTIAAPPRVELTDHCYYTVGDSARQSCAMPSGEGRIDLAHLDADKNAPALRGGLRRAANQGPGKHHDRDERGGGRGEPQEDRSLLAAGARRYSSGERSRRSVKGRYTSLDYGEGLRPDCARVSTAVWSLSASSSSARLMPERPSSAADEGLSVVFFSADGRRRLAL
jgi:hypothetical protein